METVYISYIHSSGNKTTQPLTVDSEMKQQQVKDYKKWLLESGEAQKILD